MAIAAAILAPAAAWAIVCGGEMITTGISAGEVVALCGPPVTRVYAPDGERWHYDCDPHGFVEILVFSNGTLTGMETARRGRGLSSCGSTAPDYVPAPPVEMYGNYGAYVVAAPIYEVTYVGESQAAVGHGRIEKRRHHDRHIHGRELTRKKNGKKSEFHRHAKVETPATPPRRPRDEKARFRLPSDHRPADFRRQPRTPEKHTASVNMRKW